MKKITAFILTAAMLLLAFASCTVKEPEDKPETQATFDVTKKEVVNVRIVLTDGRSMEFELYPDIAPITVQNFVDLATSGFYDGLIFHRVISNFMIQGGDPKGDGTGGSDKKIKGEFSENGVTNDLKHTKGVISMARKSAEDKDGKDTEMDSATSQFFIVSAVSYPSLDGKYAAFGKMTKGFKVLADLQSVATNSSNKPLEDIKISYIRVIEDN